MAVLLFVVQYIFWAFLCIVLFTYVAQSWHRRQHCLFGLNMTAALCCAAMLNKLLMM